MSKRDEVQQQHVNSIRYGKAVDLLTEMSAADLPCDTEEAGRLRREWLLAHRRGGLRLVDSGPGIAPLLFCDACGERVNYADGDYAAVVGDPPIPFFAHKAGRGDCLSAIRIVLNGADYGSWTDLNRTMKHFIHNLGIKDLDAVGDPLEDLL